ncbi:MULTISPECIES: hypothetical protein [Nostoc]|uniref:Uncharacterized protein n=1 Tax=Nostoc paludosum FACHB-159 TaxID=2692908 RepID=A0ABR8K3N9_9NOSO|nr:MULTISPECIES: hypothetical protein [Nostoc]MBD2678291.1 hypothetical protein [Nostoc sp. FACHB-857]MBD2733409.1 hypothetical protein [Nostoc paludosum FACHB-159]
MVDFYTVLEYSSEFPKRSHKPWHVEKGLLWHKQANRREEFGQYLVYVLHKQDILQVGV